MSDIEENEPLSFAPGYPAENCLATCHDMFEQAQRKLQASHETLSLFQYVSGQGSPEFRNALSVFLTENYGDTVKSSDLMLNASASQGLHFITTSLFTKEHTLFIEDPTYYHAEPMLKDMFGTTPVAVSTDAGGLSVDDLESKVSEYCMECPVTLTDRYPYRALVYIVPTFNNPCGFCYSAERCAKLVEIARRYDLLLVCDDVYNLLYYTNDAVAPRRMKQYDKSTDHDYKGHVVSNCSFSKIFAPSVRLGWIEATPRIINMLRDIGFVRSGGSLNHYVSKLMTVVIETGLLKENLCNLRRIYGRIHCRGRMMMSLNGPFQFYVCPAHLIGVGQSRMKLLCHILEETLPHGSTYHTAQGGYFVWVTLPSEINAVDLRRLAKEQFYVDFLPGVMCSPTKSYTNCIRLSVSLLMEDQISVASKRLMSAITAYMDNNVKNIS